MSILMNILASFLAFFQEKAVEEPILEIPIRGLTARCCEAPVLEAIQAIPGVKGASLRRADDVYLARLALRPGETVRLSALEKALEQANRKMGDAMGTRYAVDDSVSLEFAYLFLAEGTPEPAELEGLPGFRSVSAVKGGFRPVFRGEALPTLSKIRETIAFSDVVFAPSREGVRFVCAKHPEQVFTEGGSCPDCGSALERLEASVRTAAAPVERPRPKKSGC